MTSTRLLIVTDDANMGGTFRVAEQLVGGLRAFFDVRFACAFNARNSAARAAIAATGTAILEYQASERNPQHSTFAFRDAERLVEISDPDVLLLVEGAEIWSLLALKRVAELRGIPYVTGINLLSGDCLTRFPELRERSIEALQAARALVFVSNASKQRFERLAPLVDRPKHVVTNSCSETFFAAVEPADRIATRQSLGLREDETAVLCAARVEPRKGQGLCLEALETLRSRGGLSGVRLVFAGGGAKGDVDDFRRAVETKGLTDHVLYLGPRDDVARLLAASDAFILASYAEGMPLSIIEAMAKGRPVIATTVDGVPEQIDRASGVLVPSPSESREACVEAIADAIALLSENARARIEMGGCARLRARELFGEGRMIGEYARILSDIAASAPPRRATVSLFRRRKKKAPLALDRLLGRDPPDATDIDAARRAADWSDGLAPGSTIDFSDAVQCWDCAGAGWSQAEPDGVWSEGPRSTLRLRIRGKVSKLRIVFDLTPFVPPGHRQETEVFVDGAMSDVWVFDAHVRDLRIVDIRASRLRNKKTVEIRLAHRSPAAPCAFGLGADSRELGIFLHEIKIEQDPVNPSFFAGLELGLR